MYRNTLYMCIILVANIIWHSGHAIRSSYLLDFSLLHHSCWPVFTVFYVTTMWHDRIGHALNGDTIWPPNRTFNAQKRVKAWELARRLNRLFLILNTAIHQKVQKRISYHRYFNTLVIGNTIIVPQRRRRSKCPTTNVLRYKDDGDTED